MRDIVKFLKIWVEAMLGMELIAGKALEKSPRPRVSIFRFLVLSCCFVLGPAVIAQAGALATVYGSVAGKRAPIAWIAANGGVYQAAGPLKLAAQVVTANTTLTTSSPSHTFCSNATATITLANATTAGRGFRCWVSNTAGSGNVSVASTSNINGAGSENVTVNGTRTYVSSGTTWVSF